MTDYEQRKVCMIRLNRREFLGTTVAGIAAASQRGLPLQANEPVPPTKHLPTIPYGAVYFRKSNPPKEDWERDYKQASADGMNCFRHWFLWSAIEVAPGKYDWDDYDRQLDLAAKYGIKTIVADVLCTAPQWAFKEYPHAWIEEADGTRRASHYTVACSVGGWPGLCLDNKEVRAHAEQFLRALVTRYRDHPAMGGYDVWNELNHNGDAGGCFCEASAVKFREWLAKKYETIDALNKAWYRYSYRDWDDIDPPRTNDPYPDSMDWIQFRIDNAMRLFEWRVGVIRELDAKNPVTAHCIPMGAMREIGPDTYPVFQVGRLVDVYGYSGGCNHEEWSKLRWQHWCKMDMTRMRFARQAVLGCRDAGRRLVANVGWPRSGRRARLHRVGRQALQPDAIRWRSARRVLAAVASAVGRLACRQLRLLRHGRFTDRAVPGRRRNRQMGQSAEIGRSLESQARSRRRRYPGRTRISNPLLRHTRQYGFLLPLDLRRLPRLLVQQHPGCTSSRSTILIPDRTCSTCPIR